MNARLDKALHEVAVVLDALAEPAAGLPIQLIPERAKELRAELLEAYDEARAEERNGEVKP